MNNIHTTTSRKSNILDSDTELAEKNYTSVKYLRKTQILKVNHHSKKDVIFAEGMDIALLN